MSLPAPLLVGFSTVCFVAAASAAKAYTTSEELRWLACTLVLYTLGNLIMLRLISVLGMGVALSLSAVVQLIAVNLVAVLIFGERLTLSQGLGIAMAILSIGIFSLGGYLEGR